MNREPGGAGVVDSPERGDHILLGAVVPLAIAGVWLTRTMVSTGARQNAGRSQDRGPQFVFDCRCRLSLTTSVIVPRSDPDQPTHQPRPIRRPPLFS